MTAGATGYYLLGHGDWAFGDCLYMTAITISTVGFSEVIDISSVPGARLYTAMLILFGMGVIVYFGSTVVAIIVEGEIKEYFWRRKMEKAVAQLQNHIILCGAGTTGIHILKELIATRTPFIVIDECEERIRNLINDETGEFPYRVGDASDDRLLVAAGIAHARGLIAALPEDKDNLFVVISARQLNPNLRIVSRGIEQSTIEKLKRVGADAVVSPNFIGGMRMASEMIRPQVVQFLDMMLKDRDANLRVEEVAVEPGSAWAGKTLHEAHITRKADVLVVAARTDRGEYVYNPKQDFELAAGSVLIVLGPIDEVSRLRNTVS